MHFYCAINSAAEISLAAAITDIWFLEEFRADDLNKIRTELVAGETSAAQLKPPVRPAYGADVVLIAGKAVGTGVIIIAFVSGLAEYKMASNLF